MKYLLLILVLCLTACGTAKKIMKNCEPRQVPYWDCEEP